MIVVARLPTGDDMTMFYSWVGPEPLIGGGTMTASAGGGGGRRTSTCTLRPCTRRRLAWGPWKTWHVGRPAGLPESIGLRCSALVRGACHERDLWLALARPWVSLCRAKPAQTPVPVLVAMSPDAGSGGAFSGFFSRIYGSWEALRWSPPNQPAKVGTPQAPYGYRQGQDGAWWRWVAPALAVATGARGGLRAVQPPFSLVSYPCACPSGLCQECWLDAYAAEAPCPHYFAIVACAAQPPRSIVDRTMHASLIGHLHRR